MKNHNQQNGDEIDRPPKTYSAEVIKDGVPFNITLSAADPMEAIHVICKTEHVNKEAIVKIKEL